MAQGERSNIATGALARNWQNSGPPVSGTSGTKVGQAGPGEFLWDVSNGVMYVNEGTKASPYWSPAGYDQAPLFGVHTDWRDGVGVALAGTTMDVTIAGSGVRVFGDGHADIDSGAVANTAGEGGTTMRLTTTNEAAHIIAIGMDAGVMQPDQHQALVLDVELTNVTAITSRAMFIGFVGTAIGAFVAPVTGATTVATLVQDDLCGIHQSTGYTDGDALYLVSNKSNAAATQDLTAAGDLSTNLAAAATYQRFRIELHRTTTVVKAIAFVDKAQVGTVADALDEDEECSPVVALESLSAANVAMDVRRFATWATR